jgi:hypothetical protein
MGTKRVFTLEHRQKLSEAGKRRINTEESNQKRRLANIGKTLSEEHKNKIRLAHYGIKPNEETRLRMSLDRKGKPAYFSRCSKDELSRLSKERWQNPYYRNIFMKAWKGKKHTPSTIEKMRLAKMGHSCSEETKKKIGEASRARCRNPEYIERLRQSTLNRNWHPTKEMKEKHGQVARRCWENPVYAHKVLSGVCQRPNKKEAILLDIINGVAPNQYRFTGDGSFSIYRLHPDFTNINGQKKVIEHYGKYWHKGQNPQDRINKFAEFGYQCLIIWEQELKDKESVAIKVREFNDSDIH